MHGHYAYKICNVHMYGIVYLEFSMLAHMYVHAYNGVSNEREDTHIYQGGIDYD